MKAPEHGGRLQAAAAQFKIPLAHWLDLSTGINPLPWQPPQVPLSVWQRLPDSYADLEQAACNYYGRPMLPIPGSQWAIQTLPAIVPTARVWLPRQAYEEHGYWWQHHDHPIAYYDHLSELKPAQRDTVLVINPNNPTAQRETPARLLALAQQLAPLQGHLVVDEAFIDATPDYSLLPGKTALPDNLLVLRSVGKFFGLAGLRLGFVFCNRALTELLTQRLGPWAVNHPAAYLGQLALTDRSWQQTAREQLLASSASLHQLLVQYFPAETLSSTPLFSTVQLTAEQAESLFRHCAQQGILLRLFPQWHKVRIGLATTTGLQRLKATLECWDI